MKKPANIPTKIRLLEKARMHIVRGQARGLCYALSLGYNSFTRVQKNASLDLRVYVRTALKDSLWLSDWQIANGLGIRSANQVRQDRLDWIDWMIADYKKWGAK